LVTAMRDKPTPEIRFCARTVQVNVLTWGALRWFTSWRWIKSQNLPIERRTLNHWTSPPRWNVRRQCPDVKWCYVPLGCC